MNVQLPSIKPRATYQDVLDAPDTMVAELIRGSLHLHPRPRPVHAQATAILGMELGGAFDRSRFGPGGWRILDEPELHLDENVLVPDLAGWRRERLPKLPEGNGFTTPPDWVCEVLSPSTRTYDLTEKREPYGEHGVSHLWLVDPVSRTLEAFEVRAGSWTLIAALHDDAQASVPPFDALAFPLSALWAE